MSRPVRHRRSRTTSENGYYLQPAPAATTSAQHGGFAGFVLWLVGWIVWVALAVLLSLLVIGAWWSSPLAGVVTTALALPVAYLMVRER